MVQVGNVGRLAGMNNALATVQGFGQMAMQDKQFNQTLDENKRQFDTATQMKQDETEIAKQQKTVEQFNKDFKTVAESLKQYKEGIYNTFGGQLSPEIESELKNTIRGTIGTYIQGGQNLGLPPASLQSMQMIGQALMAQPSPQQMAVTQGNVAGTTAVAQTNQIASGLGVPQREAAQGQGLIPQDIGFARLLDLEQQKIAEGDMRGAADVRARIDQEKQPSITNLTNVSDEKFAESFGKERAKAIETFSAKERAKTEEAYAAIPALSKMSDLFDNGLETGELDNIKITIGKTVRLLGGDPSNLPVIDDVADLETTKGMMNKIVIPFVKQLGVNPTNEDADRIESASPGIGKGVDANRALMRLVTKAASDQVKVQEFIDEKYREYAQTRDATKLATLDSDVQKFKNSLWQESLLQLEQRALKGTSDIPQDAIEMLRSGNGSAAQFDKIFGVGAAARVLAE